jgi:two-component sensor histidine kinase
MNRLFVIAVASEKGGVGKTTIAINLAVYLKALREDLPVTIASFDNHFSVDQMFALGPPATKNIAQLFEDEPPSELIRLGQYGVQYVASSRRLKPPNQPPHWLRQRLGSLGLTGLLILDTRPILDWFSEAALLAADLVIAPVKDQNGHCQFFVGVQKEIRERDLDTSVDTVNSRLLELQNRVQTDMSMIINMIRQQSRETTAPEDFVALSRRIETLQLLYEEMKISDARSNKDEIQLGSYLSRLACAVAHIDGRGGVRMSLQVEPLNVPIETATRVGLVLSEVLTNAFQHAFERLDSGLVEVRMSRLSEGGLRLIIADDGLGIPNEMQWPNPKSVGGRIITGLIEGLEGTLQLGRGAAGSVITIDVPAGASETA